MTMRTSLVPPLPASTPAPASGCQTCNPVDPPEVQFDKYLAEKIGPLPKTLGTAGRKAGMERAKLHRKLVRETGMGLYYGDHIDENGVSHAPKKKVDHPVRGSNCLDYALEVLGSAYGAAGKDQEWKTILAAVKSDPKGERGTTLARELQKKGWTTVYWNPDVEHSMDGVDRSATYLAAAQHGYGARAGGPTKADVLLVNYAPNPYGTTVTPAEEARGKAVLERLQRVPFYFGLVEMGTHTFVGGSGMVSEMHWDRPASDPGIIQESRLEAWTWKSEAEQRMVCWGDGLLMIPPGDWAASAAK